jgi:2-polyprenyl-3-methyl-5-hydroxy-6-metoxy-1,4-benzoquinol methylase
MTPASRWKAVVFLLGILEISINQSWADSAEDRIRSHFNIPASVRLTEESIKQAVLRVLSVGSPAISIRPKLLDLGIGEGGLSRYIESEKDNVAVIRIDYDSKTFEVVKKSYIISIYLTSEPIRTIQDVTVKEWFTGP